jgi:hypothetical protein
VSLSGNVRQILLAVYSGYPVTFIPIWLGLAVMPAMFLWRTGIASQGSPARAGPGLPDPERAGAGWLRRALEWLSRDRFCALLTSLPFPLLWSALDFQWYPDFYVFLPYAAIGCGWLLHLAFRGLDQRAVKTSLVRNCCFVAACLVLLGVATYHYRHTASTELELQRAWANEAVSSYGDGGKLVSIGLPEALVLLHETNPNPYVFIINGIDNRIEATATGGFTGWLVKLIQYDPQVIFYGSTRGRFVPQLEDWIAGRYVKTTVGEWTVYVKDPAFEESAEDCGCRE